MNKDIKSVYLLYRYMPKYRYGGFINEGHYLQPIVCSSIRVAKSRRKKWKHYSFIKRVKLYDDD